MDTARIFKTGEIITAQDVFDGKYNRYENFVDVEEDFRVRYWKGAKNHGKAHFKLYLSLEDYNRLSPEQKSRYDILSQQRHFQESSWHREWESRFSLFAEIEKTITNPETNKRKRADAFYKETNTCIEFQHSFIDYDFEERNEFYKKLGISTIWLYDLTHLDVVLMEDGAYKITEDNAKGFFRIAEDAENLKNTPVFIQAKDGLIYEVQELFRKQIDNELQSTIRYFYPVSINTADEFIAKVKNNELIKKQEEPIEKEKNSEDLHDIYALWQPGFQSMVVYNSEDKLYFLINEDRFEKGTPERDYNFRSVILYQYVEWRYTRFVIVNHKKYRLNFAKATRPIWKLEGFIKKQ